MVVAKVGEEATVVVNKAEVADTEAKVGITFKLFRLCPNDCCVIRRRRLPGWWRRLWRPTTRRILSNVLVVCDMLIVSKIFQLTLLQLSLYKKYFSSNSHHLSVYQPPPHTSALDSRILVHVFLFTSSTPRKLAPTFVALAVLASSLSLPVLLSESS